MESYLIKELSDISLSMFRKNFFGIFYGSISAKSEIDKFIINKKDVLFDKIDKDSLIELYYTKDYRWNEADRDADIHLQIYKNIDEAKYISFTMPPYTVACSLKYDKIIPKDYFGLEMIKEIEIYDPKDFQNWSKKSIYEIPNYLKKNDKKYMVIKGYGIFIYDRDLQNMANTLSVIENSCKILSL
ncbi:MAG: hypothetical protein GXO12_00995 [Epsilonproteobacteria bacterium]|nr:hypothetical protein [Campylobacterota bacterium]